jgi:hypothetical protein
MGSGGRKQEEGENGKKLVGGRGRKQKEEGIRRSVGYRKETVR